MGISGKKKRGRSAARMGGEFNDVIVNEWKNGTGGTTNIFTRCCRWLVGLLTANDLLLPVFLPCYIFIVFFYVQNPPKSLECIPGNEAKMTGGNVKKNREWRKSNLFAVRAHSAHSSPLFLFFPILSCCIIIIVFSPVFSALSEVLLPCRKKCIKFKEDFFLSRKIF